MIRLVTWFRKLRKKKPVTIETHLKAGITQASKYLILIFIVHIIAMQQFENLNLSDAIWMTLTTVTTVGYGDITPSSIWGRTSTVILLYFGGIFILAKVAGDYFDYRVIKYQQQLMGRWRWNVNNHIVIISGNSSSPPKQYFERLAKEFRLSPFYKNHTIQILTMNFQKGLPESLQQLGIIHYNGKDNSVSSLEAVNIDTAEFVIILAKDIHDKHIDGHTFDILHRVRDLNKNATVLTECVDDMNRKRLQEAGADIVIRPIRAYPEIIVRAFNTPGSEIVIENMFYRRSVTYQRFNIPISDMLWADIVTRLILADVGTAIAYVQDGEVHCNPSSKNRINAEALIAIVVGCEKIDDHRVRDALQVEIIVNQ